MAAGCVVVIGHVDHGKTALVRALTGVETDRLAEEKARGLSIVAGYAHLETAQGTIDLIDAPGHADFVQAMVASAAGATAALIVISAAEGMAAQTTEHLQIAALLGIRQAVIAVTKADLLAPAEEEKCLAVIKAQLKLTDFASSPMVLCSAIDRKGLRELTVALSDLATAQRETEPRHSLLPIDRVFTMAGHGTVVTGTLQGEDMRLDTPLRLWPAGQKVQLRGLQSRGADRDLVQRNSRVAANLRGIPAQDIRRGDVLTTLDDGGASDVLDAKLTLLPGQRLKHMQKVRLLIGTANAVAEVRLYRPSEQAAFAQLRLDRQLCTYAGQRGILRALSPPMTLGAAHVLDPLAKATGAGNRDRLSVLQACDTGSPVEIAAALEAENFGVARLSTLARLCRQDPKAVRQAISGSMEAIDNDSIVPVSTVQSGLDQLREALTAYHAANPLRLSAPTTEILPKRMAPELRTHLLHRLVQSGDIRVMDHSLALTSHDPFAQLTQTQRSLLEQIESIYREVGLSVPANEMRPAASEIPDLTALLIHDQKLIELRNIALNQSLIFHRDALDIAADKLRSAFPSAQPFTTGAAREALSTTRRIIVPILEHFDATGITRRDGDTRTITT